MVRDLFPSLEKKKILLLGDLMLDSYTLGRVDRISPEAPVPVLLHEHEEDRPGGAANAACSLAALNQEVFIAGRVGYDKTGEILLDQLALHGVNTDWVLRDPTYSTTRKCRFISGNQQIMRLDQEEKTPLTTSQANDLLEKILPLLHEFHAICLSDYGKGGAPSYLFRPLIQAAHAIARPFVVDPTGKCYKTYQGAMLLKPNLKEAYAATSLPETTPLSEIASQLLTITSVKILMITLGSKGIALFSQGGEEKRFPPLQSEEVRDVTGAGDVVFATTVAALANDLSPQWAAQLSILAAGISVTRFGSVQVSLEELSSMLARRESLCQLTL